MDRPKPRQSSIRPGRIPFANMRQFNAYFGFPHSSDDEDEIANAISQKSTAVLDSLTEDEDADSTDENNPAQAASSSNKRPSTTQEGPSQAQKDVNTGSVAPSHASATQAVRTYPLRPCKFDIFCDENGNAAENLPCASEQDKRRACSPHGMSKSKIRAAKSDNNIAKARPAEPLTPVTRPVDTHSSTEPNEPNKIPIADVVGNGKQVKATAKMLDFSCRIMASSHVHREPNWRRLKAAHREEIFERV